jgi:hypothetical protein
LEEIWLANWLISITWWPKWTILELRLITSLYMTHEIWEVLFQYTV